MKLSWLKVKDGQRLMFPLAVLLSLVVLGIVFRVPLTKWFIDPLRDGISGGAPASGKVPLPDAALRALREGFERYEKVRALLAADELEGLAEEAQGLSQTLEAARAESPEALKGVLERAVKASTGLRDAAELEGARAQFGQLSEALVMIAAVEPSLQKGRHIFECPMVHGYAKWFQTSAEMANPYMGQRMLKCGGRSDWGSPDAALSAAVGGHDHGAGGDDAIAHYVCPMHPSVKQATPGQCPLCGMDLVPVTKGELASGVVLVDEARRQRIGVKTQKAATAPMSVNVRALGRVTWDETKLVDVTVRVMGWVHDLKVDAVGQPVRKGEVLFNFYSPELLSAQQELLLAASRSGHESEGLLRASRQRLRLWGLTDAQLDGIIERGQPMENVPVLAPASGYVMEKEIVAGANVMPGMRLYRIAPLDRVWIEAEVYEADLPHVKKGQTVEVTLPFAGGASGKTGSTSIQGKVDYVYPWLTGQTRTGKVRVSLANREGLLKPDMYANLTFRRDLGERLQIPASAVVYTGPRRLVFVDMGDDRFRPQEVQLGARGEDSFEVLKGLEAGDVVVTSGNFLIAAETRLRSGALEVGGEGGGHEH